MARDDFTIEEILLEAEQLKKRAQADAAAAQPQKAKQSQPAVAVQPQKAKQSQPAVVVQPKAKQPQPAVVVQPKNPATEAVASRTPKTTQPQPAVVVQPKTTQPQPAVAVQPKTTQPQPAVVVQPKKTETEAVDSQAQKDRQFKEPPTQQIPKIVPIAKTTPIVSAHTRILYAPSVTEQADERPVRTIEPDEQLRLDDLALEEQASDEELEEQLRQARQKRIEGFRLIGGKTGLKLSGEEEDNDSEDAIPPFEDEEELEDYNQYEETEAVRAELVYRRRMGRVGVWVSTLLAAALLALTAWPWISPFIGGLPALTPAVSAATQGILLLAMMIVNHRLFSGGLKRFFCFQADANSAAAVTAFFTLLLCGWQLYLALSLPAEQAAELRMLGALGGFGLWTGALGKQSRLKRILRNFDFVSEKTVKHAALPIENERAGAEMARSAAMFGVTEVIYSRRTPFLTGFLENSYGEDTADGTMRRMVPLSAALALIGALLTGAWTGNWTQAPTVFVLLLCLAMPATALWNIQLPITRCAKRTLQAGGMMIGWEAARRFGEAQAVVTDTAELFPESAVRLHGIKTFHDTRIDAALMAAASLAIKAGGTLAPMFRRVIEGRTDILPEAESLAYEQELGLSGWVDGRRVLFGTRKLLENHGVEVPPEEYELKFKKNDREVAYLSVSGELSALYVIGYKADEQVAESLRLLQREGLVLLVRQSDLSVTAAALASRFDADEDGILVLSAAAGRSYEELTAGNGMREPAVLASDGSFAGLAGALVQCSRLAAGGRLAIVPLCIGGVAGVVCGTALAMYFGWLVPPLIALAHTALWGLVGALLPLLRRC